MGTYPLKPIRNSRSKKATEESVSDLVYERLKAAILSQQLEPGARLREIPLSRALNASRTPLRRAIDRLAMERLIHTLPNGGRVVANPSQHEIADIYEMRIALEALAARLAAVRSEAFEHKTLDGLCQAMKDATKRGDFRQLTHLNAQFHTLVAEYARNGYLKSFVGVLRNAALQVSPSALRQPGRAREVLEEHLEIFKCIKYRDANAASQAMAAHLERTRDARILDQLLKGHNESLE